MSIPVDHPEGKQNEDESDQTGRHPSSGLAGKINGARSAAPEGATDAEVISVGREAHDRGITAEAVWAERDG